MDDCQDSRSRSHEVRVGTEITEPARTPELACSYRSDSLRDRYYIATIRGGLEPTIRYKIRPSGGWEQAQARGLGRAWAVALGR
eukprot:633729-Pleurochrysis_carterae.AAC.1